MCRVVLVGSDVLSVFNKIIFLNAYRMTTAMWVSCGSHCAVRFCLEGV